MSGLPRQVEESIRARRLLRPGQPVLVGVSGGVDSMVLLHVLHGLAPRYRWRLTIAHLNHQLRGQQSDRDEQLVRRAARRLKLPLRVERADVRRLARAEGVSLEMAARQVRHEFLARTAAQGKIPAMALAHHADDQVELFFLRLLRGAGGDGLGGMRWKSRSPADARIVLVRPLLDCEKAGLLAYAEEEKVPFREDASNRSVDMQRNRLRHKLLPLLREGYQPALNRVILRAADIAAAEAELAIQAAQDWLVARGRVVPAVPEATLAVVGWPFEQLPVAVQRHVLRLQLLEQGIVADYALIERLRETAETAVAVAQAGRKPGFEGEGVGLEDAQDSHATACVVGRRRPASLPPKPLLAVRDREGMVRVQVPAEPGFCEESRVVSLAVRSGEVCFGGAVIQWRSGAKPAGFPPRFAPGREVFDADRVGKTVILRHWRPGDRFQPTGMACAVKLQDLFTNLKVPAVRRRELIVATTASGELFWVEEVRIAERFKLSKATIRRLQWQWKRP